jgi:hypothetical protein
MGVKAKSGPAKGSGAPGAGKGKRGGAKGQKGKSKKNKKKKHKCGDSGKYGEMQRNYSANGMERDHIPSGGALCKKASNMLGKNLCKTQQGQLKRAASACAIPKGIHADFSETFRWKNNPKMIAKDAGNLKAAAKRNTAAIQKGMKGKTSKECQAKYKKWAEEVNNRNNKWYENLIQKALPDKKWT